MKKKSIDLIDVASAYELCEIDAALSGSTDSHLAGQVHHLLYTLREVEEFSDRLIDTQFRAVIHEAILACGFVDEVDAWEGVLEHLRSGVCDEASCQYHIPLG